MELEQRNSQLVDNLQQLAQDKSSTASSQIENLTKVSDTSYHDMYLKYQHTVHTKFYHHIIEKLYNVVKINSNSQNDIFKQ